MLFGSLDIFSKADAVLLEAIRDKDSKQGTEVGRTTVTPNLLTEKLRKETAIKDNTKDLSQRQDGETRQAIGS